MHKRSGTPLSCSIKRLAQLALFVATSAFFVPGASAEATYDTIMGNLPGDNTAWAVVTPAPIAAWNGTLILDLDGSGEARKATLSATLKWLLAHGYAYGGITRTQEPGHPNTDYNFVIPVEKLVAVRRLFIEKYGVTPFRTIAWGNSRGGFVGRVAMELHPDIFSAALLSSGGGAGEIAFLNSRLDGLFVLKTLVDPASPLKIVGVANNAAAIGAENAAMTALVNLANATPAGRARLALAAAMGQFSPWISPALPEPPAGDYDAQLDQLLANVFPGTSTYVFAHPPVVRAPIEAFAGGVVSWNHGVNYAEMLARSGRSDFVKALYEKAGLDPEADLKVLAETPRISADPAAVAKAEKVMSYSGEVHGPIINIDNDGDPVDSQGAKIAYEQTLRRAGNEKLFRLAWVHSAGHSTQTAAERLAGLVTLVKRLDTGKWGDTSAKAMNALATTIAAEDPALGAARFLENHPAKLLRTWDASNWNSYKACDGYQPGRSFESCR